MRILRSQSTHARSGVALAAVISMLAILGVLLIALLGSKVEAKKWTDQRQSDTRVQAVADAAIAMAADRLWKGFERQFGPEGMQPWNFRTFLEGQGIPDQAGVANIVPTPFLGSVGLDADADGNVPLGGGYLLGLGVVREDTWDSVRLTISAQAAIRPTRQAGQHNSQATVQQSFAITRPAWGGLDFALLANNVNCILCHAKIDDAARFYNQDPTVRGGFDRVRVGSLESIQIRSDPESTIAGSLYLGGKALEEDGDPLTNWAGLSLKSGQFDSHAKLIEDAFGALAYNDLHPADAANPSPGENLYLNYLDGGAAGQVDGALPTYFPSPFPDNGGFDPVTGAATPAFAENRILDTNEFYATAGSATGSVLGGRVAVVPVGTQLSSLAQLDSRLDAGSGVLGNLTTGNVVLVGTEANPILLDGTVAIDGDVILSGFVKGSGSILASGNVFIPGDLQYMDGSDASGYRTYGSASDGTNNAVAVTAGGNVTIGDPSHPSFGRPDPVDGTPATDFNFIMDELAIFNRGEWIKTQPELPGKDVYVKTGTKTTTVLVKPTRKETYYVDKDIYSWQPTGNMISKDVYGWVQTGTKVVNEYTYINHPADPPEPYGSPWTEKVWVGSHEEPVNTWQVTGTTMVAETAYLYLRTDSVKKTRTVPDGDPYYEDRTTDVFAWVTPMHPNPGYAGPNYIPRYYAYSEGAPVPIYNQQGYFDPASGLWHCPERAESWTNGRLSVADPGNPSDPFLYDAAGQPKAVVQTVAPKADWVTSDLLSGLVDRELAARDSSQPLEIDATLYSANSIFGMVPARNQPGVDGRMLVNGGLVAADIGVLAPKGIQINFDERSGSVLSVADDRRLTIRRTLYAPAPGL
ncbi:MAG: hypothetical protein H6829_04700 [Planctomycetes bacterium]|nr:hypothetical protein [Planctomycetota bacterium]MCB9911961.1 hypothetical protein [Planctomycetota bacterium]HPF13267.1 hypothetical protein [Planctomycetota bacterium]